jgi:beta-lactamase regulating signal transducer with metallopeptidase domain
MTEWVEPLLSNAIAATLLAILVGAVALLRVRPSWLHALWLIVLLKFVTPPLLRVSLPAGAFDRRDADRPIDVQLVSSSSGPVPDIDTRNGPTRSHGTDAANLARGALEAPPLLETDPFVPSNGSLADAEASDQRVGVTPVGATWIAPPGPLSRALDAFGGWWSRWLSHVVVATWFVGSGAWFTLAAVRLVRFRRELVRARIAGGALQQIADDVAERLGLRTRPIVRLSDAIVSPMLTTYRGRGLVLLPTRLFSGLSREQRAAIIAHELAHLRRGDHFVRWLEFLVIGLYWWHPVAWLARRQLQQAEESCCDAWVMSVFPDQSRGYAQALLATVDFLSEARTPAPAGACGFGPVHSLQRRLEMILKRNWRPDLSATGRMALIGVALTVLPWTPRAFSQAPSAPANATPRLPGDPPRAENTPNELPIEAPLPPSGLFVAPPPPPLAEGPRVEGLPSAEPAVREYPIIAGQGDAKPTTEQRLDRLEGMLQSLLAQMQNQANSSLTGRRNYSAAPNVPQAGSPTWRGDLGGQWSTRPSTLAPNTMDPTLQRGPAGLPNASLPMAAAPSNAFPRNRYGSPRDAQLGNVQAQLEELNIEIQSLELKLRRAQAEREYLQTQVNSMRPPQPSTPAVLPPPTAPPSAPAVLPPTSAPPSITPQPAQPGTAR